MLPHQILALGTQNRKGRFGFKQDLDQLTVTMNDSTGTADQPSTNYTLELSHQCFYLYQRDIKIGPSLRELEPTSSGTWGRIWTNSDSDSSSPRAHISRPCSVPQLPFTRFFLQVRLSLLVWPASPPRYELTTLQTPGHSSKTLSYLLYTVSPVFSKVSWHLSWT